MRSKPELRVVEFLDAIGVEEFGISTITVWEILNGIGRLDSSRRRAKITEQFHGLLVNVFEEQIFDWTPADARVRALIMETKRRRGEPLDSHLPDAMIAATAVYRDLTIITRNERDFRNTGAKTVNPWAETSV